MRDDKQPAKEAVTITEMARAVGLSRARFYQLMKEGIFPSPSRNATTKRPSFDRAQQEQCLLVRKTNCGINGRAVLFYGRLVPKPPTTGQAVKRKRRRTSPRRPSTPPRDPVIDQLRHGLEQLGLGGVTNTTIRAALADEQPDGHRKVGSAELLMSVFRRLKRQDSPDNVS